MELIMKVQFTPDVNWFDVGDQTPERMAAYLLTSLHDGDMNLIQFLRDHPDAKVDISIDGAALPTEDAVHYAL